MLPILARIGALLARGGRYATAAAKALRTSRLSTIMRTHGIRLLNWAVSPLTKYGTKMSTKLAARFVMAGRSAANLAIKYPKLARPLNAIAKVLTSHGNAKFLANLAITSAGVATLDVTLRAIVDDPRGDEAQEMAQKLQLDLSEENDAAIFDNVMAHLRSSVEYMRFVNGRSVAIGEPGLESPSFASQREELARAVGQYILHGSDSAIHELLSSMTAVGFLQITGRLASLATEATAYHENAKAQKLARIRLFLLSQTGVALHDGVNKICEAILRSSDEVMTDALELVDDAILANAQGVADFLADSMDEQFNSAWANIKGFFMSDSAEAEHIYELLDDPEKRVVVYAMSVLGAVVPAGASIVNDLLSSDDEELRFAAEAANRRAMDVDASGDIDDAELSAKSRIFARACLEGSGSKLHDALFDE